MPLHDGPLETDVDEALLAYRLVPTSSCSVVDGQWVFQSGAFDNATPEDLSECPDDMSVVLSDTLATRNRDPRNLPEDTPWAGPEWGVAVVPASYLTRDEGQQLYRTAQIDEPAHGDVHGKKNSSRRKRIKKNAEWLIPPAAEPTASAGTNS